MDVGALTPPLWGFRGAREADGLLERASGARMHSGLFPSRRRASGPAAEAARPTSANGSTRLPRLFDDDRGLVTDNRIFKQRNVDIGVVTKEDALKWGFSGVMVRGSGIAWDLRKAPALRCL
jgi:NADH-quinone oxidoreductase subunit D